MSRNDIQSHIVAVESRLFIHHLKEKSGILNLRDNKGFVCSVPIQFPHVPLNQVFGFNFAKNIDWTNFLCLPSRVQLYFYHDVLAPICSTCVNIPM